jgi:hypothetical protein
MRLTCPHCGKGTTFYVDYWKDDRAPRSAAVSGSNSPSLAADGLADAAPLRSSGGGERLVNGLPAPTAAAGEHSAPTLPAHLTRLAQVPTTREACPPLPPVDRDELLRQIAYLRGLLRRPLHLHRDDIASGEVWPDDDDDGDA